MKAPISWLKEYVEIKLNLKDLMWKLTEVGLTTESFEKKENEIVLVTEVTPNRPDWLSITGIAREIAAIENKKIKIPLLPSIPKPNKILPLSIKTNYKLSPRYSGIVISGVGIKPSPEFIQKRLILSGLRPINNLVDITNYVMLELGIPIHVFDYDKFFSNNLSMELSKGGENFSSVDEIKYKLPQGAIIIKDSPDRVIDLCGIKGGGNTGIGKDTKNIFIHVPIYNPILIRKTSQALRLASEASYIYERGANAGGTIDTLKRVVSLILKYAGGEVSSEVIDEKAQEFKPKTLVTSLTKIENTLGIKIPDKKIISILDSLNLSPKISQGRLTSLIPTYRGDIKIDEDIIEEIARIYGYNNFPKTLPVSGFNTQKVPYCFDETFHNQLKNILVSLGFYESINYSLMSAKSIEYCELIKEKHIKLINPVSIDYEYLRTSLIPWLIQAVKLNENEENIKLFELSKVYLGTPGKTIEPYKIAAVADNISFREFKGYIDTIFERLNIEFPKVEYDMPIKGLWHPNKSTELVIRNKSLGFYGYINPKVLDKFEIKDEVLAFEFDMRLLEKESKNKIFKEIPKYPPQIEDITLDFPLKTMLGEVVKSIYKTDNLIDKIELKEIYKDSYTFRIRYQHKTKTLLDKEIRDVRNKVLATIMKKYGGKVKD